MLVERRTDGEARGRRASLMADLSLVGICVIWGTSFAIVKTVVQGINPAAFIAARFALAAVLIGLGAWNRVKILNWATWRAGLLLSIPLFSGFILQTHGLGATTASKAGFITGMHVVFTPLLQWIILRRRVHGYEAAGVGVALAGLGMLTLSGSARPSAGDLLVLACAFAFAVHIVMLAHYSPRHDVVLLSFTQMVWAALLAALVAGRDITEVLSYNRELVLSVAYLGAGGTALAYLVQTVAQKYTPPIRAALILQLEPVFAAIFARILIAEQMSGRQYAGAVTIFAGILVCQIGDSMLEREVS
ncbi:MAG: DMT family transporter [Clostridia bacterium]|nr:DMT family transporter [Clostridia bacterium]